MSRDWYEDHNPERADSSLTLVLRFTTRSCLDAVPGVMSLTSTVVLTLVHFFFWEYICQVPNRTPGDQGFAFPVHNSNASGEVDVPIQFPLQYLCGGKCRTLPTPSPPFWLSPPHQKKLSLFPGQLLAGQPSWADFVKQGISSDGARRSMSWWKQRPDNTILYHVPLQQRAKLESRIS